MTGDGSRDEVWKAIPGTDGWYEISNLGRARSFVARTGGVRHRRKEPKMLTPTAARKGYWRYAVRMGDRNKGVYASRAVLLAFVGPPPDGRPDAAHLNGVHTDNRLVNLAWASRVENESHKIGHGTALLGSRARAAKLTEQQVAGIKRRLADGEPRSALATEHGVKKKAIDKIADGVNWKHIDAARTTAQGEGKGHA